MKLKLSHRGYSRSPEDKEPEQLELNLEPYIPLSPRSTRTRIRKKPNDVGAVRAATHQQQEDQK